MMCLDEKFIVGFQQNNYESLEIFLIIYIYVGTDFKRFEQLEI